VFIMQSLEMYWGGMGRTCPQKWALSVCVCVNKCCRAPREGKLRNSGNSISLFICFCCLLFAPHFSLSDGMGLFSCLVCLGHRFLPTTSVTLMSTATALKSENWGSSVHVSIKFKCHMVLRPPRDDQWSKFKFMQTLQEIMA